MRMRVCAILSRCVTLSVGVTLLGASIESAAVAQTRVDDPAAMFMPRDRRAQGLLEQARSELQKPDGDHRQALESLQRIIDEAEDVFTGFKMDVSLRAEASRILAALPDSTRRMYEETAGPEAAALLESARGEGMTTRREIVRRFFHTAAGAEAAYRLAVAEMDSGRLLSAARLFDRLRTEHHSHARFDPELSVRCLLSYWRGGDPARAADVLVETIRQSPNVTVWGQPVPELSSVQAAQEWLLTQLGPAVVSSTLVPSQWPIPHGAEGRNAAVSPVSPLFDDAWSVPLVRDKDSDDPVQVEELATLVEGLAAKTRAAESPAIPEMTPLVVGDLVVFPSYGLVKAIDVNRGTLRWVALPADQTFVDSLTSLTGTRAGQMSEEMDDFLLQRAWLDSTSSQISSDGGRVYLVRDSGMVGGLPAHFASVAQLNHPRRPKTYNALRAYDAAGGSWIWEIGGARMRRPLPLAGTFFLGPPLPVEGTLYVLGEDLGQIRLHALKPQTGQVLWSLPLVNADTDIEEAVDRRLAGLSPTFAGGLLICPTGGGLIVAVDPATRSLVWGTRYRDVQSYGVPQRFGRGPFIGMAGPQSQIVDVGELMRQPRWHDACIVAAGGSLLVTPPDVAEPDDKRRLLCLNLVDGRTQWQRAREDALYVGGVHAGTVLLIGQRQAEGVDLANGHTLWTLPLGEPSGHGVRSGRLYHLPLASGEIATLDIESGRLLARSPVRSGRPLGNLIAAGGRLISQSATEVRAFRTRPAVEEQLARDLEADPDSPAALAVRGESRLHAGETAAALDDLRAVLHASDDSRSRQLLVSTLLEGLRSDFALYRARVDELDRLSKEPELRRRFLLTYADGLLAAGEPTAAFEQYLRLLGEVANDAPLEYVANGRRVRPDRRVQGELARLYQAADDDSREGLDRLIEAQRARVPARDGSEGAGNEMASRLAAAFPHLKEPSTAGAEPPPDVTAAEAPARREARLLRARRSAARRQQAKIAARLIELYVDHGRAEPAVQLLEELARVWAEAPCLEGKTGGQWAAAVRETPEFAALSSKTVHWPTGEIAVREGAGNTTPYVPLRVEGPVDPLVSAFLFLPDNRGQIAIQDGYGRLIEDGVLKQLSVGGSGFQTQYVMQRGHRAVVFLGTQFKLIDLIDGAPRILLEDLLVDSSPADVAGLRINQRRVTRQIGFRGEILWSDDPGESGSVGPLNDSVFCYLQGTTLHAHDPFTGNPYWTVDDAPHGAEIFADEDYVVLVPIGQNVAHIYRALDGEKVAVRNLPADVERDRRGADWGRCFLCRTSDGSGHRFAMYDPVTEQNLWERTMPQRVAWAPRDGRELCLVDEQGHMTLLDPISGQVLQETQVDVPENMMSVFVLSLPDQWLLTTYRRPAADDDAQLAPAQLTQALHAVNGPVTAFDRQTGKVMWSRVIGTQMVSPAMPARWPILSLSAVLHATPQLEGQRIVPVLTRRIELINRWTGTTLHATQTDGHSRRLDVFWLISEREPQLRLRYGLLELEVAFREDAPQTPEEPAAGPPPPAEPQPQPTE